MKVNNECLTDLELDGLIAGNLSAGDTERFTEHLDLCHACQQRLTSQAGMATIEHNLVNLQDTPDDSTFLSSAIDHLKNMRGSIVAQEPAADKPAVSALGSIDETPFTSDGFELIETLGRGGMGVVYKAREVSLDRFVAIKVLSPTLANDESSRLRFLREARSAAAVVHRNVITIHAVSDKPPIPYLVMEFVDGISLHEYLSEGNSISVENIVRIGRQVTAALDAAHSKGVIHRDIKPANIMINSQSGNVLLGDFGLACVSESSQLTRTGVIVGTPAYVAPEVLESDGAVDQRSDLFSLGVLMYALCTGRSPFQADTLLGTLHRISSVTPQDVSESAPQIPSWLSQIVMRLLDKDPSMRFQSAIDVRNALGSRQAANAEQHSNGTRVDQENGKTSPAAQFVVSKTSTQQYRDRKRRAKNRNQIVLGALLIAITLVVGIIVAVQKGRVNDQTAGTSEPIDDEQEDDLRAVGQFGGGRGVRTDEPSFICLDSEDQEYGEFQTFEEALRQLRPGTTIEITSDGTIALPQTVIEHDNITITASEGIQPTLRYAPDSESEHEAMLIAQNHLKLNGIQLHVPRLWNNSFHSLVQVEETGSLTIHDCSLITEADGHCIVNESENMVSATGCIFRAPANTAISLRSGRSGSTFLESCWFVSESGFDVACHRNHRINVKDNRFICENVFSVVEQDDDSDTFRLTANHNLFLCMEALLDSEGEPMSAFDSVLQVQSWEGRRNIFCGNCFDEEDFDDEDDWRDTWDNVLEQTDSRYIDLPEDLELDELFGDLRTDLHEIPDTLIDILDLMDE